MNPAIGIGGPIDVVSSTLDSPGIVILGVPEDLLTKKYLQASVHYF